MRWDTYKYRSVRVKSKYDQDSRSFGEELSDGLPRCEERRDLAWHKLVSLDEENEVQCEAELPVKVEVNKRLFIPDKRADTEITWEVKIRPHIDMDMEIIDEPTDYTNSHPLRVVMTPKHGEPYSLPRMTVLAELEIEIKTVRDRKLTRESNLGPY